MSQYTFLITGGSSGLGYTLAIATLQAGHKVIATARNVSRASKANPDLEKLGGIWLELDVTSPSTQSIVSEAVAKHNINVVINNAGYALRGVIEDLTMEQVRAQMETNYFGALAVTKGCIPHFRQRRSGMIVQMSSASGFNGTPSQSQYSASKFALEGASESLAKELEPFGVRVLIVEPGMLRTPFQKAVEEVEFSEEYVGTPAHQAAVRNAGGHGKQIGDPVRVAEIVVEVITGVGRGEAIGPDVFRVILGSDSMTRADMKLESFTRDVEASRRIASSTDFPPEE